MKNPKYLSYWLGTYARGRRKRKMSEFWEAILIVLIVGAATYFI